ncbi:AsnC family protein [Actinophytocola algeriensis]|uniref:AsnC family protein n=1 Tax=Actinophytocola algeriensis TaxID=1768010 RepID=A0A7W7QB43_9PSEU|nr:AsnC family protein [Actinophytocola algeriensis]MBB4910312.1 hypothetical protein [Actinophytocola algeriensis]MBE1480699.1 hypothetical protein [Actinophytocola algeriensis]
MTDPVDARLLGVVAEMGRAAVHEVAARVGMDPREVASRLVALSATGLPLLVGVECDPARLGQVAAAAMAASSPPYGVQNPYGQQQQQQYPPSGPMQTPYPPPPQQPQPQPQPQMGPPSGPHSVPQPMMPRTGPPSAPFPAQTGPPSQPFPASVPQPVQQQQAQPLPQVEAPISMWGPPQTSTWARGDAPPQDVTQPTVRPDRAEPDVRQGKVGSALQTEGLEGERLSITLVEVVDPADYLFTAAGYRLQEGERSVVVHTELTNRGAVAFQSLPDLYLVLVTPDGKTISKAPVSLSSRPPHRIGVPPGDTQGGHTVYVVPENTEVTSVRWSPRPDEESRSLTWTVEN